MTHNETSSGAETICSLSPYTQFFVNPANLNDHFNDAEDEVQQRNQLHKPEELMHLQNVVTAVRPLGTASSRRRTEC